MGDWDVVAAGWAACEVVLLQRRLRLWWESYLSLPPSSDGNLRRVSVAWRAALVGVSDGWQLGGECLGIWDGERRPATARGGVLTSAGDGTGNRRPCVEGRGEGGSMAEKEMCEKACGLLLLRWRWKGSRAIDWTGRHECEQEMAER